MKTQIIFLVSYMVLVSSTMAQKGAGDLSGIAHSNEPVNLVELSGIIDDIKQGPCENTSGRSVNGTHLMVVHEQGTYNIHLGPTAEMKEITQSLKKGDQVYVVAFRTEKLPAGQYIAKSLSSKEKDFELRDDTLRPFWAVGKGRNR